MRLGGRYNLSRYMVMGQVSYQGRSSLLLHFTDKLTRSLMKGTLVVRLLPLPSVLRVEQKCVLPLLGDHRHRLGESRLVFMDPDNTARRGGRTKSSREVKRSPFHSRIVYPGIAGLT